jgi:DNA (cytosine-5)-methyltransferase 1
MTHLDLFSGIGGFTIAAEWAGFQTVGFAEIEPYPCAILKQNWPHIKNYGSVDQPDNFRELRGRVTVLTAGVPCQPASLAGQRRGASDDRWKWPATLNVVELVRPTWCIFENPPGILSLDEFEGVLLRLGSLGYEIRAFCVPASALGAGHLRYRVFIVANANRPEWRSGESTRDYQNGQTPGWVQGAGRSLPDDQGRVECDSDRKRQSQPEGRLIGERGRHIDASEINSHAIGSGLEEWSSFAEYCRAKFPATQRTSDKQHCLRGFWYAESPLCGGIPRVPNRSHRLKALGNSVCPAQAFPFFEAIAQVERDLTL